MTQFLLKMGAMFNVSFLILYAVLSQEMVVAFDDDLESSSVLHTRQKRMNAQDGTEASHQLPPFLAHNLRQVHLTRPTAVRITNGGATSGVGYAIHPYIVVTRLFYLGPSLHFGVSMYLKYARTYAPQRVKNFRLDDTEQYVVISLKDPLLLDVVVPGALANYPLSIPPWAYHAAEEWILSVLPDLHRLLAQNLHEIHLDHPTLVQIRRNNKPPGDGYAIHPYIVITRPRYIRDHYVVTSHMESTGEPKPHRVQHSYPYRSEHIVAIQLLDPVLLTYDASVAFHNEHFSIVARTWAHGVVENWIQMMLSQGNHYLANREPAAH